LSSDEHNVATNATYRISPTPHNDKTSKIPPSLESQTISPARNSINSGGSLSTNDGRLQLHFHGLNEQGDQQTGKLLCAAAFSVENYDSLRVNPSQLLAWSKADATMRNFRRRKAMDQYLNKIKHALTSPDIDVKTSTEIIEDALDAAANDIFELISNPKMAPEYRVGIIFNEMSQNQERWNSYHLEAVMHVMTRLEEMRKEAPE
jgi:hypothetical protein